MIKALHAVILLAALAACSNDVATGKKPAPAPTPVSESLVGKTVFVGAIWFDRDYPYAGSWGQSRDTKVYLSYLALCKVSKVNVPHRGWVRCRITGGDLGSDWLGYPGVTKDFSVKNPVPQETP